MKKKNFLISMHPILSAFLYLIAFLAVIPASAFGARGEFYSGSQPDSSLGLKDYYKGYFTMGVAVAPTSLSGDQSELILKHFGSLTAENVMKPGPIHPEENRYNWENADKIVKALLSNLTQKQIMDIINLDHSDEYLMMKSDTDRLLEHFIKTFTVDEVKEYVDNALELSFKKIKQLSLQTN